MTQAMWMFALIVDGGCLVEKGDAPENTQYAWDIIYHDLETSVYNHRNVNDTEFIWSM